MTMKLAHAQMAYDLMPFDQAQGANHVHLHDSQFHLKSIFDRPFWWRLNGVQLLANAEHIFTQHIFTSINKVI